MDDNCLMGQIKHCRLLNIAVSFLQIFHSETTHLFKESAIELKSTVYGKIYQQSSENQFRTNWRQLFININLFNDIDDCLFYRNIYK